MSSRRFHCERLQPGSVNLNAAETHHAYHVLRLRQGQEVSLFDGRGRIAQAKIIEASAKAVRLEVEEVSQVRRADGPALTLMTALPRAVRQQVLFEKCTELGVARIVPVRYARSTVKPKTASIDRWRRTAIEAAKQCGCAYLPIIEAPKAFNASIEITKPDDNRLFGATDEGAAGLIEVHRQLPVDGAVAVWIGPEGGLTDEEEQTLIDAGARPIRLSRHILRIETACIAVAATFSMLGEGQ